MSEEKIEAPTKNIGPVNMLNLIAKKADKSKGTTILTNERSLNNNTMGTERQQADIFDQLNVMNQMLGQNHHNGYHQLEPKIFPTNNRALEEARNHKSGVASVTSSLSRVDTGGNQGNAQW